MKSANPFKDRSNSLPVKGVILMSASPILAELAIQSGFDSVWIEMEHGAADFKDLQQVCLAAEAAGGFASVRVPDSERNHILRSLDMGAKIVLVPQVDDQVTAERIVLFGKYAPLGKRGFNSRTRAMHYGMNPVLESMEDANLSTALFAQIETVRGVQSIEAICSVEGLDGIFLGPGDLSLDMGIPTQFNHPDLISTVVSTLETAKTMGKLTGIMVGPGVLLDSAMDAGVDLVFCGGDIASLTESWRALCKSFPPHNPR